MLLWQTFSLASPRIVCLSSPQLPAIFAVPLHDHTSVNRQDLTGDIAGRGRSKEKRPRRRRPRAGRAAASGMRLHQFLAHVLAKALGHVGLDKAGANDVAGDVRARRTRCATDLVKPISPALEAA